MDQTTIRDLLYRIATDPEYRARLIADPVGVLGEIGIQIDPSDVPVDGITLPPADEILRHIDEWSRFIWDLDHRGIRAPRIWIGGLPS